MGKPHRRIICWELTLWSGRANISLGRVERGHSFRDAEICGRVTELRTGMVDARRSTYPAGVMSSAVAYNKAPAPSCA